MKALLLLVVIILDIIYFLCNDDDITIQGMIGMFKELPKTITTFVKSTVRLCSQYVSRERK